MALATACAFGAMAVDGREGASVIPDDAQDDPQTSSRPASNGFDET